jgi:hypothetical protein
MKKTILTLVGLAIAAVIVVTAIHSAFENAFNDPNWLWVYLGVPLLIAIAIIWGNSKRA